MPVRTTSFFIPSAASVPYILEDIYFKGGLRVAADAAARDAISEYARKPGMLVVTANTNEIWQLQADALTYKLFKTGNSLVGVAPIAVLVNGSIKIDPNYILPQVGKPGDFLVMGNASSLWQTVNLTSIAGARVKVSYTALTPITPQGRLDFMLPMAMSIMMLETTLDTPLVTLLGYAKPDRLDANPYMFESSIDVLYDSGIIVLADASKVKGRRYNVLVNLESPVRTNIYWTFVNKGSVTVTPTVTFTFLVLQ
jgi:hypothetical protein